MDEKEVANNEVNSLFTTVYTRQDLLLFYKEIDQFIAELFKGDGTFEEKVNGYLPWDKKDSILEFLKTEKVRLDNPVEIKETMSKIQKLGDALPVVSLKLAFDPPENILKNLSSWFLRRMQRKVVFEIARERAIIGGVYISYNGLYKDYTLRTKMNTYFDKQSVI